MLGSRLARRIVLPLLLLIAVLFGLLAIAGVRQADGRVEEELEEEADRIAATVGGLALPADQRAPILGAVARLLDVELVLGDDATLIKDADPGLYRELERPVRKGTETLRILVPRKRIEDRRRDFLGPVLTAAALGLAFATLFGFAVARMIVKPVQRLAVAVEDYGAGADQFDPGPQAPAELGVLQRAFVAMAGSVRDNERFAALGRLSGGIAHELRNPLTAIRMAVETGGEEAEQIALAEIDRLDRTLRELLDFVRPRELAVVEIDVPALLDDVANLLRPQCEHLSVKLEVETEPGATLMGDRDKLQQALLNLVLNGAQAQPHGGAVYLRGSDAVLEVRDEGPGIADEVMETLFDPFVTTRSAGIGLGLAVVKQIADEHGATIELDTGADGTTFRLRFATAVA
ncbi:MAG: sensor histidine kinase [Planctomycetota bacterium]